MHTHDRTMTNDHTAAEHHGIPPYLSLALQLLIGGAFMYGLMYLMIARVSDFYLNLNMLYMTLAMLAPMAALMLLFMPSMLPNRSLNLAIYAIFAVIFVSGIWFTRAQTFIGDDEFLRSMIPHHSGAILMCEQATLRDPEIVNLCGNIVQSQSREIAQMQAILARRS
jgi:hypothetical protein